MGLFIWTSPYAGINRIRFKGIRGIAISGLAATPGMTLKYHPPRAARNSDGLANRA
jgi:hypothetical protein